MVNKITQKAPGWPGFGEVGLEEILRRGTRDEQITISYHHNVEEDRGEEFISVTSIR